jgi:hypothetical protein
MLAKNRFVKDKFVRQKVNTVVVRSYILIALLSLFSLTASAETFDWAPEFNVGDAFPSFSMVDQDSNVQTNDRITGDSGYLVQFNRSVVW